MKAIDFKEQKPQHIVKELDRVFKVYIPKDVRDFVGLGQGSKVELIPDEQGRGILLRPVN